METPLGAAQPLVAGAVAPAQLPAGPSSGEPPGTQRKQWTQLEDDTVRALFRLPRVRVHGAI